MSAPDSPQWILLGRISGLFGVRGAVKIFSFTEDRAAILDYPTWYLGPDHRPIAVREGAMQGETVTALLAGINDREAARGLLGQEISVPAGALPALGENEFYWRDLLDLQVVNLHGEHLGAVVRLLETGANDVLVLQGPEGERLVPWTASVQVDRGAGTIVVDWEKDW